MAQIGVPQLNILEPIAGGYPATTPPGAGTSSFILGQNLIQGENQREGGRNLSETQPVPNPARVSVYQPDEPVENTEHKLIVPSTALDANGNRIVDSDAVFTPGTNGGPFDGEQSARDRAMQGTGRMINGTVLAAPLTIGFGVGYGAFSGGTPAQAGSGGYGGFGATQLSFSAINRTGSRNHANLHVVSRPGAAEPFLV